MKKAVKHLAHMPLLPTLRCRSQWGALTTALVAMASASASAAEIDTGNADLRLRWDNTVKYSTAFRVKSADPALLSDPNQDDGDRNFGKGLISNRFDLLSEADLIYQQRFGARVSGAAWYDTVYNKRNDNPGFAGGAFPNQSGDANQFTNATRDLMGRKAELLDGFVFGKFELGDESNVSLRLGQHALIWGETLFFGANGIAGTMSPIDANKAQAVPSSQTKEIILPVPQISGQMQITPSVMVAAYYQFQFRKSRLPAVGSYFSANDLVGDGGQRILLGPLGSAPHESDLEAKNSGQGGLQLRYSAAGTDYALYAIRFHDKTPQVVANVVPYFAPPPAPPGTLIATAPGSYRLVYQEGITALGASVSHTFGPYNFGLEASIRHNQDLASSGAADLSALGVGGPTDNRGNPGYAVGNTAHVNLSVLATLSSTPLWREASLAAEIAWNRVTSITKNAAAFDPNASRSALAFRGTLEPTYRQVVSGLDVGVPLGLGFSPKGSRSGVLGPGPLPPAGGGDMSFGLNGNYLERYHFTLAYTHYYGPVGLAASGTPQVFSYRQSSGDRDFVTLSASTTF